MRRSLEIDAGNGEVFTVESSVDGVRSVFPAALAKHSRTHDSEEDAWTWIHQVRARQAAEQDRTERDFDILIETVSKRTFRVKAASFDEAASKYVAGEAVLVSENHSDPSDVQVIDSKSGQWVFYGAADEGGSGGTDDGPD